MRWRFLLLFVITSPAEGSCFSFLGESPTLMLSLRHCEQKSLPLGCHWLREREEGREGASWSPLPTQSSVCGEQLQPCSPAPCSALPSAIFLPLSSASSQAGAPSRITDWVCLCPRHCPVPSTLNAASHLSLLLPLCGSVSTPHSEQQG